MQKEHRNIDELFKSELSDIETPAPAFVKKRLTKKLFGNKKFLFFVIPLLTLIFGFSFFFFQSKTIGTSLNKNNIELFNKVVNPSQSPQKKFKSKNINENHQINNENKISGENTNHIIYKEKTKKNTNSNTVKFKKTEFILDKEDEGILTKEETLENTQEKKKILNTGLFFDTKEKTSVDSSNEEIIKGSKLNSILTHQNTNEISLNKIAIIKELDSNSTEKEKSINNINYTSIEADEPVLKSTNKINILHDGSVTENDQSTQETDSMSTNIVIKDSIQMDLNNTPNPKSTDFLFSLSSGVNISNSTYSSTNTNDGNYYKSSNTDKLNIEHNLTANFIFKNKFLVGSGIGINKQSYDYNYNETKTSTITYMDSSITTIYIYGQNDSVQNLPPVDTVYQINYETVTDSTSITTPYFGNSSAEYIHIPLQLGYLWNYNRFMFGVQANIRYNILYKSSGQYYSNDVVNNFDKSNSIFKSSYFDFALKTDIYYNILDQIYLNGSIKYVPSINNTYQNLEVERKLNYLHFGLGLTFKL
jgi:hypothetical protein